jgi:phosphomethylpyrimidine synthase
MKISQDVREYAARKGIGDLNTALEDALTDKAGEFLEQGAEIYRKV